MAGWGLSGGPWALCCSVWACGCGCVSPRECGLCALWPQAFQRQLLGAVNDAEILGLQRRVW